MWLNFTLAIPVYLADSLTVLSVSASPDGATIGLTSSPTTLRQISLLFLGYYFAVLIRSFVGWARRKSTGSLQHPPGRNAQDFLSFLFAKKTFEKIFAQAILDMREEYFEALAAGRKLHARWILWRDHGNLVLTVMAYVAASVLKKRVNIWKMVG